MRNESGIRPPSGSPRLNSGEDWLREHLKLGVKELGTKGNVYKQSVEEEELA